jgi:hypothetical protein
MLFMIERDEKIREAMSLLGKSRSEKKLRALAENRKNTLFKPKPLSEIACNCGGRGLEHKSTCPRGRAIRYRKKKNLPLI